MKNLPKMLTVALFALVVGGLAWAGGSFVSAYIPANGALSAPTSATAGIPLYDTATGKSVTDVSVSIVDVDDGGTDTNYLWLGGGLAYRYNPTTGLWARDSSLDVTCPTPVGWAGGTLGCTVNKTLTGTASKGERLYYVSTGVMDDAGAAFVHKIVVQGRYNAN